MSVSTEKVDFLIIGGGVAGLRAAIELAQRGSVLVLTKDNPAESSTGYAQGGIAVALSDEDEVGIHYKDTIKAGNGLCREDAVKALVEEGPGVIRELISWGAQFDKEGSRLAFTKEAAHSRKRILHAHGDSTGKELERVLINKARSFSSVSRHAFAFTMDLIIADGRCIGAVVFRNRELIYIYAKAVVLATGGAGQLFSRTTNPLIATGDGMAIAYRAGALLEDMEFIQFHPTTLYSPSAPQFLLSEAMRGEGAVLKNIRGRRFMPHYHKMAELAPRDIVTRAIISEMVRTNAKHVYLDLRHLDRNFVKKRFPRIYSTCLKFDIDITEDLIPVSPAAHYIMGGVKSNLNGKTNIRGLFVAGEVACTGVHGANRLASNSLLEGLVYGARAGRTAALEAGVGDLGLTFGRKYKNLSITNLQSLTPNPHFDIEKIRTSLRRLMWNKAGIIRCRKSLNTAKAWLKKHDFITKLNFPGRAELELKNMLTVANLIVDSALLREGSSGAHYRSDFKEKGKGWHRHSICRNEKPPWWGNV
ncbi:MAG: L-aspartate oxidase [Nitrospirae bacterium]|nr:L-aspartate oxidase [Nitrospirota bacterium]